MMGIFIFLIHIISSKISAPFSAIEGAIEKIMKGDLSARILIEKGPVEIKNLARQSNIMAESIQEKSKKTDQTIDTQTQKIKKQKEKFEALANDLKKFKLAVESASDQIIITDPDGKIIYANKAMEKITGFSIKESLGKKSGGTKLGGGLMPKKYYEKMWDTIKNKKKSFVGEIKNQKKNGEEYISQIRISPILNKKGDILFFVAIRHDITKERETEKMKNEFVDIVSHELRTPMTLIKGYVSIIIEENEKKIPKEAIEQMQIVLRNTEQLIKMVNDLLDVSKIEAGKMESMEEKEQIKISELFQKIHDDFTPLLNEKGIRLELELPKKPKDPSTFYNRDALRRVFTNIIGNSIKFVPEQKGKIVVKFQKTTGKFYEICIEERLLDEKIRTMWGWHLKRYTVQIKKVYEWKIKKNCSKNLEWQNHLYTIPPEEPDWGWQSAKAS
jgi:PAS domain S-box-containing protein